MKRLLGCGTALVTPFKPDGTVDYSTFRTLVQRQLKNRIDFLVPLGSTGEAACLKFTEKVLLLEAILEETAGRIPIVAGIGSNDTQRVIEDIQLLNKLPLYGFLVVTPYYNKPTQAGLYNHFKAIAEATNKAIVLYNVPGRTAVNLSATTTLKLAELKNVVAIKEASSCLTQISEIIQHAPRNFTVLSGNDNETLPLMSLGAQGVISVASNLIPSSMTKLVHLLLQNKILAARKLHQSLSELFTHCFIETNPIPIKAGMASIKLLNNVLRAPLTSATPETLRLISTTIRTLGVKS